MHLLFPRKFYELDVNDDIVHYSPYNGEVGKAYWGAYAASKFAVKGLAEIMRDELDSTTNIKVFNFDPGLAAL